MGLLASVCVEACIYCLIVHTADASSTSSALTMGSPRSAFPTSSSSKAHSSTSATERAPAPSTCTPGEVSSRGLSELLDSESKLCGGSTTRSMGKKGAGGGGGMAAQQAQTHHQMTPSKRSVLNISPPPEDLFDDSRMSCQDELSLDSEQSNSIWTDNSVSNFSIMSSSSYNDNTEVPRKARKRTPRQRPGPKPIPPQETSMDMFDADSAKAPHFVLSQLGPDSKACTKGR